jgi:hypothetical protein
MESLEKDLGPKTLKLIDKSKRGLSGVKLWILASFFQEN